MNPADATISASSPPFSRTMRGARNGAVPAAWRATRVRAASRTEATQAAASAAPGEPRVESKCAASRTAAGLVVVLPPPPPTLLSPGGLMDSTMLGTRS